MYAVLSAVAVGMISSCIRWLLIDHLLHMTGVRPPTWNPSQLEGHLASFTYLVESHYRYYQFYGNTIVAVVWTYMLTRSLGTLEVFGIGTDVGVVVRCAILFAGARDALAKYYARTKLLVGAATIHRKSSGGNDVRSSTAKSSKHRPASDAA